MNSTNLTLFGFTQSHCKCYDNDTDVMHMDYNNDQYSEQMNLSSFHDGISDTFSNYHGIYNMEVCLSPMSNNYFNHNNVNFQL